MPIRAKTQTANGSVQPFLPSSQHTLQWAAPFLQNCPFLWADLMEPHTNTWFLGPMRANRPIPNGTSSVQPFCTDDRIVQHCLPSDSGCISPKFSAPQCGKAISFCRMRNVFTMQKWHGPPLSPCQVWLGSDVAPERGWAKKFDANSFCRYIYALEREIVITTSPLSRFNLKMVLIPLDRKWFIVVHPHSNLSLTLGGANIEWWPWKYGHQLWGFSPLRGL